MRAFLIVLVLLGLLVVGGTVALGYSRDWFHLTVNEDKVKGDTDVHLTVNKDKMKGDTDEAKKKLQELGQQVKDRAGETVDKAREKTGTASSGSKTATGQIKKVEAADNRFLMTTTDNVDLTVYTDHSSTLRLHDQQIGLEDLRVGDEVKVDYDFKDQKDLATAVTVKRK